MNGLKKERYRRNMLENIVADCPRILEIPEMIRSDVSLKWLLNSKA